MTCLWRWFIGARVSAALRMAIDWRRESTLLIESLRLQRGELKALCANQHRLEGKWAERADEIRELSERMTRNLDNVEILERQHETAIKALERENQVLSECAVKPLVAQNQMLLNMWNAQVAIEARKQGLAEPMREAQ
jgi:predicted nuclease with TOPRIM domain